MKTLIAILLVFTSAVSIAQTKFISKPQAVPSQPTPTLPIGAKAPDFRLPSTTGKYYSLKDFASAKVLVIIFTCTHCPTAQAYEDRMKAIVTDYKNKDVAVVAIMPNSPPAVVFEELGYTDLNDDYENMAIRAKDKGYNFPYLYDGDTEATSIKYGPVATPHAYVFDSQRILKYNGRLDGIEKPGKANAEDLRAAIDATLAGKDVATPTTKTFGCSIKWAWHTEYKGKVEKNWEARPVTLEELDTEGVKKLVSNDSDKLRLINVWATWCGPCILEYPDFLELQRMYGARDFEFVSLTADKMDKKDKALKFLQSKHSGVKNYIFKEDDTYKLIEAIDPKWNGALPYTLLVEPGGKVVYSLQGSIDNLKLKKIIVDHPKIGRYF
ncbi:redoxin family protein [Emticicia sp. C21]|uniref:redoxin family protein n=1 Tax=Emticicia sp. C21 TaxID=2302915 RepID=UPI000E3502AE|nr:redoxin family protein [Emticicia sp. C21]RFS18269.1 redoxin [Emticicia sp. C21]